MEDSVYMPPDEWIRDWSQDLIHKKVSKGEGCRRIARNAASWGFGKGLAIGEVMGATQELKECCAQLSQCHMIPEEQRAQIASYLHETRTKESNR